MKPENQIRKELGLLDAEPAMLRAADHARLVALQTRTPLVFWRDGKIVHVRPEDLPVLTSEDLEPVIRLG